MPPFPDRIAAFFAELKRRKVYRVAVLYALGAYAVIELSDIVLPALGAPEGSMVLVLSLVLAGFPIAVLLGWTYDLTRSGLRRDPADRREPRSKAATAMVVIVVLASSSLIGWTSWGLWNRAPLGGRGESATPAEIPEGDARRIAVLYFDDHSPGGELGYLAAGITESLLHELGRVPGLHVASRNSVKPFRDTPVSTDSIASALRVGTLVEGSVTRSGERVRATVQLIDARTAAHLDSRIVEGSIDSLLSFQDALADSLARQLRRHLGREVRTRGARVGATSQEAWILYLRARELLDTQDRMRDRMEKERQRRILGRADTLLARARALDPDWSEPAIQSVEVASRIAGLVAPWPGAVDTAWARVTIGRADTVLAEHPEAAEALEVRGWTRLRLARTPDVGSSASLRARAEADLERAARLDPRLPGPWWVLAQLLIEEGRAAEALAAAERALEADVFLEVEEESLHSLFYAGLQRGPSDDAVRWCDEGLRRFPEELNFLRCKLLILGTFPQVTPDVDSAWTVFEALMEHAPPEGKEPWRRVGGAHVSQAIARAGMPDSARAVLRVALGPEPPAQFAAFAAKTHLLMGDEDEAVRLLERYLTYDPDPDYLARDWWFEGLRDHPGFRRLVGLETGPGE